MTDPYLNPEAEFDRLLKEHKKHGSLVVGVDFDGTIHDFHKEGHTYPRMYQLLRDLKEINCKIICWTAYEDHKYVEAFLISNNIPFDGINTDGIPLGYETRKPFFSTLLDDRVGLSQVYTNLRLLVDTVKPLTNKEN